MGPKKVTGSAKTRDEYEIDFIDPLFAAALGIGLTHAIIEETWFKSWRIPTGHEWFDVAVFVLCALTVLLSWVGYHESIKSKPLKGFGRFVVDVVLVSLYALLLVKFRDFGAVLFLLMLANLLFVLWDAFKVKEYGTKYNEGGREAVTIFWAAVFVILWGLHSLGAQEGILLVMAYIGTIVYRVHKAVPIWGWVAGRMFGQ